MNDFKTWSDVFNESLQDLVFGFADFAPRLIIALLLFFIGFILGNLLSKAFEQVVSSIKLDKLLQSVGVEDFFEKMGMRLNSGYFVGQVFKWFVIILFLLPSLNLLHLESISYFLRDDVLGFLPKIIISSFILIVAALLADFVSKAIIISAKSIKLNSAKMLGAIAKYAIWIFAFIIALGELGIAQVYMQTLFTGIVAMIALGGALAFGLGGKEFATSFLEKIKEEVSGKNK